MQEREIEVKIIGADETILKATLEQLGAVYDVTEEQINYRINASGHPIASPAYLRIRVVRTDHTVTRRELTFKTRLSSERARINQEVTALIENEEDMLRVLACMGYDQIDVGTKRRERYLYRGCRIEFDEWDKKTLSYPYVEIEAPSEEALERILEELKIDRSFVSTKSIAELKREDPGV
ncbi:MAG: CYTH domain-containing protein [Peptoniphilaceae bacterium]|nr:CYTH domain-containing protein [Peptoniphilaceae bacterium]